jgi:hypothetical protein
MFELIVRINQDIIQVSSAEDIKVVKKNVVYITLVYYGSISQSKRYNFIFISSVAGPESCILFGDRIHTNMMEYLTDIELSKDLCICNIGQYLVNQKERITVLTGQGIEYTEIDIEL